MSEQQPNPSKQPDEMFCPSCGAVIKREAELCVHCGVRVGHTAAGAKSKTTSILLAVFFGCFTWLYTYREDSTKFWIGLALVILGAITVIFVVGYFIAIGVWIWAIVDTVSKNDDWYADY